MTEKVDITYFQLNILYNDILLDILIRFYKMWEHKSGHFHPKSGYWFRWCM